MDEQGSVVERLARLVLVPVVEVPEASVALPLADALIAGGLPIVEVTLPMAARR